jgi:hypothetical protein
MLPRQTAILISALCLLSLAKENMHPSSSQTDKRLAISDPYAKWSRKPRFSRQSSTANLATDRKNLSRIRQQNLVVVGFGPENRSSTKNGRLVKYANSDREAEEESFRSVYSYDVNGRLSLEEHFNRDGSPTGRKQYIYDSGGTLALKSSRYSWSCRHLGETKCLLPEVVPFYSLC